MDIKELKSKITVIITDLKDHGKYPKENGLVDYKKELNFIPKENDVETFMKNFAKDILSFANADGGIILIGIKVRLLALIGSIFPLAMATFVLLGAFNLWTGAYFYIGNIIGGGGMPALVTQWIPLSFSQVVFNGIDLGTWVILLGAVLALISSFITREDY